ncbi:hypothetical protein E2F43_00100 [Seongchinamella unica]|uniref:Uncharacterized protein n=1 Tax=Seongchinamella unica TaxID=2547392 RepID=A0A4R5LU35_9GAMM|nr:hypothetical protein [Seongchinamella unica]TDG14688.1 hypothetical protein E2F43_00100 [Seongchinamella unica]
MKRDTTLLAGLALALAATGVSAQDEQSNVEIARELANPNTTLGILNFNLDYTSYKGDLTAADGQEAYRVRVQPVLPCPLREGVNLFVRPNFPVLYEQPIPRVGDADFFPTGDGQFGILSGAFNDSGVALGDIGCDVAIGKTLPSKMVLVGADSPGPDFQIRFSLGPRGSTLLIASLAMKNNNLSLYTWMSRMA